MQGANIETAKPQTDAPLPNIVLVPQVVVDAAPASEIPTITKDELLASLAVDPSMDVAVADDKTKPKKKRSKPAAAAADTAKPKKKKKASVNGDEVVKKKPTPPVRKTAAGQTTKAAAGDSAEKRHFPGYSMLKVESDKLDRVLTGLERKKENRESEGKTDPTVCGMFNKRLLKFFQDVRRDFDAEFLELHR